MRDPATRSAIFVLAAAAIGCAPATPLPAAPPAAEGQAAATFALTGLLSRKGPSETAFWAVTDEAGKVWEVVEVPPDLEARLHRLQNASVTLRVERKGRTIFEQVRVVEVVGPGPSP